MTLGFDPELIISCHSSPSQPLRQGGCPEVRLQTLQALSSRDELDEDVKRRMIRGLSRRDYDDAMGALAAALV